MALTFGAATSDRVDCGSGASIDDLNPFTWLFWCYATNNTANRALGSKESGSNSKRLRLSGTGGSAGNLRVEVVRATTNTDYITNDTPLGTLNTWKCVAITFDSAASAGQIVNIYSGTRSVVLAESTYGTATDGSGTPSSEAAGSFYIGNRAGLASSFQGRIAVCMIWNRALTLAELIEQQFRPHKTSGCVMFTRVGYNGTGTQPDWSGNGNAGTVTGATLTPDDVPLGPMGGFGIGEEAWVPYVPPSGGGYLIGGAMLGGYRGLVVNV